MKTPENRFPFPKQLVCEAQPMQMKMGCNLSNLLYAIVRVYHVSVCVCVCVPLHRLLSLSFQLIS